MRNWHENRTSCDHKSCRQSMTGRFARRRANNRRLGDSQSGARVRLCICRFRKSIMYMPILQVTLLSCRVYAESASGHNRRSATMQNDCISRTFSSKQMLRRLVYSTKLTAGINTPPWNHLWISHRPFHEAHYSIDNTLSVLSPIERKCH